MNMVTAFIFVVASAGREKETLRNLMQNGSSYVKEAQLVYGDYDIILRLEAESLDEINEFVVSKIRNMPTISTTNTLICV